LIGQQLAGGPTAFIARTTELTLRQLGPWLTIIAVPLAITGIVRLARSALCLLVAMLLLVLITLGQTYNFQNPEVAAYSEHMYMMFVAWAGVASPSPTILMGLAIVWHRLVPPIELPSSL
jgi:hypothetical protein